MLNARELSKLVRDIPKFGKTISSYKSFSYRQFICNMKRNLIFFKLKFQHEVKVSTNLSVLPIKYQGLLLPGNTK